MHDADGVARARTDVDRFLADLGWQLTDDAAARTRLAVVLATLQRLECDWGSDFFAPYAEAAEHLTRLELNLLPPGGGSTADRAPAVVRAILLDVALTAIRRLALEHHVAQRFRDAKPKSD